MAAAAERGELLPTVGQDIRLDNRFLDLRTPANQAIFRVQSAVGQVCTRCIARGALVICDVHWQRSASVKLGGCMQGSIKLVACLLS